MPTLITSPTRVHAAGEPPKDIAEFVGRVNTGTDDVSIAIMSSPPGWGEPAQTPVFEEWTLVLEGAVHVEHKGGVMIAREGQCVHAAAGETVRYSTPDGPARYVSICKPAFSPVRVHRHG
ncbi:MAG: cupin [Actinomycetia bacterium]|nr:cupin [Actinomycetes bacterium]